MFFCRREKKGTIRWQGENVNSADIGLHVINADTLSALIDKIRSSEGQGLLDELKRINLFELSSVVKIKHKPATATKSNIIVK